MKFDGLSRRFLAIGGFFRDKPKTFTMLCEELMLVRKFLTGSVR